VVFLNDEPWECPPEANVGAPHLARFSRDVGVKDVTLKLSIGLKSFGVRAVESHISPKTSEMWGTRRSWMGDEKHLAFVDG
jgi:hypothetical protein